MITYYNSFCELKDNTSPYLTIKDVCPLPDVSYFRNNENLEFTVRQESKYKSLVNRLSRTYYHKLPNHVLKSVFVNNIICSIRQDYKYVLICNKNQYAFINNKTLFESP